MSSVVDICNIALSHVGNKAISSLIPPFSSKEARQCSILYEPARDSALEDFDWGFARKEQTLALTTASYTNWNYVYAFPSDCIIPLKIIDPSINWGCSGTYQYDCQCDYTQGEAIKYEVRVSDNKDQNLILTNLADAVLLYTARVSNTELFSSLFVDVLAYRLASDLAQPLRSDMNLATVMFNIYSAKLPKALASNANSDNGIIRDVNSFVRSR